jgi:hypothetical protein
VVLVARVELGIIRQVVISLVRISKRNRSQPLATYLGKKHVRFRRCIPKHLSAQTHLTLQGKSIHCNLLHLLRARASLDLGISPNNTVDDGNIFPANIV